jgi:hypothetical protein
MSKIWPDTSSRPTDLIVDVVKWRLEDEGVRRIAFDAKPVHGLAGDGRS